MWKSLKNVSKLWYKYKVCTPLGVGTTSSSTQDESPQNDDCAKEIKKSRCCLLRYRRNKQNEKVTTTTTASTTEIQSIVKLKSKKFDVQTPFQYGTYYNFEHIRLPSTFEALGLGFIVFLGLKHACFHARRYRKDKDDEKRECLGLANFLFKIVWAVRGAIPPQLSTPFTLPLQNTVQFDGQQQTTTTDKGTGAETVSVPENATLRASDVRNSLVDLAQQYASMVVNMEAEKCLNNNQLQKAIRYFRQASDMGLDIAMYNLGVCYEMGVGVQQDNQQAFHYYVEAGKKGNSAALYNVAVCYREGIGVAADEEECLTYMLKACDGGVKEAQTFMGVHYGQRDEYDKAAVMFQKAVDQKHSDAEYFLGLCYEHGLGVDSNAAKAADLFTKSADSGNVDACYRLATFYEQGLGGVKEDADLALDLFRKAAEGGHELATERLKFENPQTENAELNRKQELRSSISSPDLNSLEAEHRDRGTPVLLPKSPSTTSFFDLSFFKDVIEEFKTARRDKCHSKFYIEDENDNYRFNEVVNYQVTPVNNNYRLSQWGIEPFPTLVHA